MAAHGPHADPTGAACGLTGGSRTRPPKPYTGTHRAEFLFCLSQNKVTPPPLKGEGLVLALLRIVCFANAEKTCAFPQEKADTSYPRASLSMSSRLIPLTTGSHGSNGAVLGLH